MQPHRLGRHLTVDFYDCALDAVRDPRRVEQALRDAARHGGATIMGCQIHEYLPQGVSGVLVIAESHITVHTWPEHAFAAADIFTCGDSMNLEAACEAFAAALGAQRTVVTGDFARGDRVDRAAELPAMGWRKALEQGQASGLTVGVDLEGCTSASLDAASGLVVALARELGLDPAAAATRGWNDRVHGDASAIELCVGGVRITATCFAQAQRARLDVQVDGYVEPRELAERALSIFGARHYQLSVALRR